MHIISCIICTDIFSSNSEIFVTKCGHIFHHHCLMQWLEQKQACPQCRKRTTESSIHRIFINFNTPNEGDKDTDPAALQMQVEYLQSNVNAKKKYLKLEKEKYRQLDEKFKGLRVEFSNLEAQIKTHESVQRGLQDQIKFFKNKAHENSKLKDDIKTLERKIKDMEQVQIAIRGTHSQVTDLIQRENNIESLALLSATLKTALLEAESKKRNTERKLSDVAYKNKELKKENEKLVSENFDLRKEVQFLKTSYEKEKAYLKQKISDLDMKISSRSSLDITNSSLKRIIAESPVNISRNPTLNSSQSVIDLTEQTSSSSVPEQVKKIKESESPYLLVKSNSVGFSSLINSVKFKPTSISTSSKPTSSKYLSQLTTKQLEDMKSSQFKKGVVFDGLGGSNKEEIYPQRSQPTPSLKRHKSSSTVSSSKFRKLSADAAKSNSKLTNFFTEALDI